MRCWGLAQGMTSKDYDVTVAINAGFPVDISSLEGINLVNWQEDESFVDLINSFDIVIASYSMGGPMTFIADHISDHVTLVLDCYVPIYIEVSARDSDDKITEYANYAVDLTHWNKALARGDYFLCANIPQKHMYMGALGALGILNPYSYQNERVLLVPFGVERTIHIDKPRNPYKELGIKKDDFVLLWFGGLYPWFNIRPLLNAIKRLCSEDPHFKFVLVGGKNPYNSHPDFIKQYTDTYGFMEKSKLINKSVYFIDWVDFADRMNWFKNANAVISINNVGDENNYSWRTRVMDFVGGEVPMITNGGDPLSDSLVESNAAINLPDTEESTLYETVKSLSQKPEILNETRHNLAMQKKLYHWDTVVDPLDKALQKNIQPYLDEKKFRMDNNLDVSVKDISTTQSRKSKMRKLLGAPKKIARMIKQKGIRRTGEVILTTISNRTKKTVRKEKRYYFLSHPIDHTGAPLVLLDIMKDFSEKVGPSSIDLVYPGGEKPLLNSLFKQGYLMDKMVMGIGSRVIHGQLGIKKDDFVLINTVAVYPNYRDYILGLLDTGRLNHAVWFIHEDKPELRFDDKGLVARIKRLIKDDKLTVYVPSSQTAAEYNVFFETDKIKPTALRVSVPEKYQKKRPASDFKTMRFVISGTPSDGRKGQLLAIAAFSKYLTDFYQKSPDNYRDFELHLIGIGEKGEDYISTQIRTIGDGLLNDRISYYPKVSKDKAMEITSKCNATICCSLNETFALFVAEGMLMGHVLIRNESSGHQEQIIDKKNGYLVDTEDTGLFSVSIEKLLNKATSNSGLEKMSEASRTIAKKFKNSNYFDQIDNN